MGKKTERNPSLLSAVAGVTVSFNSFLLHFFCFVGISVHSFTVSLQFLLPFFSVFREIPIDIQLRKQGFLFILLLPGIILHLTKWSALAFLASFLSTLLFDEFCAPCCRFCTYSHISRDVCFTTLSLSCFALRATFPAASSMPFCDCSQVFFLLLVLFLHHCLLEIQFLLHHVWLIFRSVANTSKVTDDNASEGIKPKWLRDAPCSRMKTV